MICSFMFWIVVTVGFGEGKECEYVSGNQCKYDAVPDKGCGINVAGPRLMGSDVSLIDSVQYPYMVSLQTLRCGNHALGTGCYEHFCGGTMIAPNLILTAAHCFDKFKSRNPKTRLDGLKFYTLSQGIYAAISPTCRHLGNGKYGRFVVNNIFIHPEYFDKQGIPQNDVAILDIIRNKEGHFYQGSLVKVVGEEITESVDEAQVLGYGQAQPQHVGKYIAYPLHGAKLELQKEEFCQEFLNNFDQVSGNKLNYTNMMCYWNMNADSCNGDSGGPLLTDQGIQIGLVSWGPGNDCLNDDDMQAPGVYVRLTLFANWIQQVLDALNVEGEAIGSTTFPPIQQTVQELEANTLLAFGGSSKPRSWNGQNACLSWEGIYCTNNIVTNISLSFGSFQGQGTLSPQFSVLDSLVEIYIDNNNLKGSLPPQLSNLVSLVSIILGGNDLTGTLPVEFSLLTNLREFVVASNRMTGTLPNQYSELLFLQSFSIPSNSISGTLPVQYSTFVSLQTLNAYQNRLIGTLPVQYSQLTSLKTLQLFSNSLTGTLPVEYSQLTSLSNVMFNSNSLEGSIPPQYSIFSDGFTEFFPQSGDLLCLDRKLEDDLGKYPFTKYC